MINAYKYPGSHGPIVAVVTDRETRDGVSYETVRTRYVEALRRTAAVVPVLLPTDLSRCEVAAVLSAVDGLLLTGAASNVAPALYGEYPESKGIYDPARDTTAMSAIAVALESGIPLLGICRGLQELNVALGGHLDRNVSSGPDRLQHSEDLSLPRDDQYCFAHGLELSGEGRVSECLASLSQADLRVNSLHTEGIRHLSVKLSVDAWAPDGVVEAVTVRSARSFAAAVQWHPEWFHESDSISRRLLKTFAAACADHQIRAQPFA